MDVFRVPYDAAKMVKKFHVHAVKMYYNGSVTLFRSCIASLLSGVGENYKWFSCNKVPIDVLLKYAQRGITIILNKKERIAVSKYLSENDRWGQLLKDIRVVPDKMYCCTTEDHPFFMPGEFQSGVRMGLRQFPLEINNYVNALCVPYPSSVFPYGDLKLKDNNTQFPPNPALVTACLDYIESANQEE